MTLTSRAFHNDKMGPMLKLLCEVTGYQKALPMNTGAEAVETAIKAARKWGQYVKGVPAGNAGDHRLRAELPRPHHHHRGLLHRTRRRATGSGPYTPGFKMIPYGDAEGPRGGHHPEHRGLPRGAHPGRGGRRGAPRGLPQGLLRHLQEEQRPLHRGRGPDGLLPHGPLVRLRLRGRQARHHGPRQGPRRRALPRLRHRGGRRGHERLQARRPRLHLRREPPRLRPWPPRPSRSCATRSSTSTPPRWAPTSWTAPRPEQPPRRARARQGPPHRRASSRSPPARPAPSA